MNDKILKILRIIKDGITGALTLTSLFVVSILLFATGIVHWLSLGRIFQGILVKYELSFVLTMTAGIGFILGVLFMRYFPKLQKGFLPMVFLSLPLILGIWYMDYISMHFEFPKKIKLTDATNGILNIHVTAPPGRYYGLVLEIPERKRLPNGNMDSAYEFSSHISVSNKDVLLAEFPLNSQTFKLTGNTFHLTRGDGVLNKPKLGNFMHAGSEYDIQIKLDPPPPSNSSIWLDWRQTRKDIRDAKF